MRNTITLNGVESSTIPGLLIQSLAPISKPLMRTEVETIDGRDGDITTDLGFSAYDKQISIGLFGDFDINQVIAYFNSKGTVIFSNEPDKFYNYQIVDQIDFERLVRYRTATVTMHCQPFKYSTTEGADILSTNSNFATLNQSLNTDTGFYTYSSNVQDDVTATRSSGTGGKFFAVFSVPVVQGVTYYFSGNVSKNVSMYGYTNQLRGTSAGISGKGFNGYFTYTATFTGTMVLGFYSSATTELFIRNFKISNESAGTVSAEGTNIVLEDSAEAPFSRFDLKGNTEQDTFSGKNLYNLGNSLDNYFMTANNGLTVSDTTPSSRVTATFGEDSLTIDSYNTSNWRWLSEWIKLKKNTDYVINATEHQAIIKVVGFTSQATDTVGTLVASYRPENENVTFNSGDYAYYATSIYPTGEGTVFKKIQIEAGSIPTDYEKFVGGVPSPNPEYPQSVQVVTGDNTIKIYGKNLLPLKQRTSPSNGVTSTITDGVIYAVGTATDEWANLSTNTDMYLPAGTYRLSMTEPVSYHTSLRIYFEDGTYHNYAIGRGNTATTIITEKNAVNAYMYISGLENGAAVNTTYRPQLELGSATTSFEPHKEQSFLVSLGNIELCKIGDYQDYIYKSGDKWYKHKTIEKLILDGNITWTAHSTANNFYNNNIPVGGAYGDLGITYMDSGRQAFAQVAYMGDFDNNYGQYDYAIAMKYGNNAPQLAIRDTRFTTADELKTWLTSHPETFYYALATPVDEEITNETLKAQLDAISQANAYRQRTHINALSATGNVPHIIAAEVIADPSGTITNSGNIYSKPKLTIFGSGSVGVYLNGVQMFQIALGTDDHITIDTAIMEAYQDNLQTLKNRSVTGDYNNFKLPVGDSDISFSGTVTMCVVENYSRWL